MNQIHQRPLPRRKKKTEQVANMHRLHFDHNVGYEQIADIYGTTKKLAQNAITYYRRKLLRA